MTANHDALRELTVAYAFGTLDDAERREFEAHLVNCTECQQEVRDVRAQRAYAAARCRAVGGFVGAVQRASVGQRAALSSNRHSRRAHAA